MKKNQLNSLTNYYPALTRLRNIQDAQELGEMAHTLPWRQADELIECLFNNEEEFNRLIWSPYDISIVAKKFPKFADKLIDIFISNPEKFKKIIHFSSELGQVVDALNPRIANKLMDFIFCNENKIYKHIIRDSYNLCRFLFHRNLRQYSDRLINHILKDPDYFKLVVGDMGNLLRLAINHPQHADTLINMVIKDKEHFKKLISNQSNWSEQLSHFPKYEKIFANNVPIDENEKNRQLYLANAPHAEIRKNARLFAQAERTHSGQFFFSEAMPRELRITIAGLTRDSYLCNEEEANQIAQENFSRPMKNSQ
ncbi:TPA: hypothetical protein OO122_001380 [Legionella pneumophila]|nr:hypothetical protein [Legionella pneumophila]HAT2067022.1 hypothetical protein [Legionella pneumophila]HAT8593112.1 hypothetical protein [Legionella pneumophila]HAU1577240.1 hypothetical protein [Legionella pneumophila]HAU1681426.1 hypothetical protein [Legionella pneumophila]HAU3700934.1 hypothetical protein [Legionella pneumophila]